MRRIARLATCEDRDGISCTLTLPKKPARCSHATCRIRRALLIQRAKWPRHTDTPGLSTSLRCKRFGVFAEQIDGVLKADELHRIQWQKTHSFAVGVGLFELLMCSQHPFNHRYSQRTAGPSRHVCLPPIQPKTRCTGRAADR